MDVARTRLYTFR